MSKELICGCGSSTTVWWGLGNKDCFVACDNPKCKFSSGVFTTEAEAISAFKLATRADKQGIQFTGGEKAVLQMILSNNTVSTMYDMIPEFDEIIKKINLPKEIK